MERKTGQINVNTENIFPIIRKWLYADQDIFLRELVSNASDAIRKRVLLGQMGEVELEDNYEPKVTVTFDEEKNTLSISDNGLGMTADDVDKYINQIAFSGAMDFVNKYKDKGSSDGIIGHFGLGFYSAFMVAEKVEIHSLYCQPASQAVHWTSNEGIDYVLEGGTKTTVGTDIILHLNEEAKEELTAMKLQEILDKYCMFMPYPIFFNDVQGDQKDLEDQEKRHAEQVEAYETRRTESLEKGEAFTEDEPKAFVPRQKQAVNNTEPLWKKAPKDVTDEEYKAFYRDTFNDFREPLFWIHLNMDYPSRVQGILYFPQAEHAYETLDGRVKIYNNQVFVADNIKEVIPDFLFLLKGCLDCPDLPLNVSRSFLQNDAYVKKLSEHIVRKVSDRLSKMFANERDAYEGYWNDIKLFVKYGSLKDEKFYDRTKEAILFETTDEALKTKEELGDVIRYTSDKDAQLAYVKRANAKGHEVVVMDHELDNSFMSMLEFKESGLKFLRIDADIEGEEGIEAHKETLEALFREVTADEKLKLDVKGLGEEEQVVIIAESEEARRMQEMRRQFEMMQGANGEMNIDDLFPLERSIVVNTDHPLVSRLVALAELPNKKEEALQLAKQTYDLARLAHGSLNGSDLLAFMDRSMELLSEQF